MNAITATTYSFFTHAPPLKSRARRENASVLIGAGAAIYFIHRGQRLGNGRCEVVGGKAGCVGSGDVGFG
jgi:hypothetical protein